MSTSEHTAFLPSGTTQLFVIISDPVAQLQIPAIFNDIFRRAGLDAVLVAMHVGAHDLGRVFEGLRAVRNLAGIIVGVPHKPAILAHADRASEMARIVGAANALRRDADGRWYADNFDGDGFLFGLRDDGHKVQGRRALLVGAGGAGSAIAAALLEDGLAHLRVVDLDRVRAGALAGRLATRWPGRIEVAAAPDPVDTDLVINATPLGSRPGDPLPFDLERLAPGTLVVELIVNPAQTPLLREAARRGLPTHRGIYTLSEQIRSYAEFFGFSSALDRIDWSEHEYQS